MSKMSVGNTKRKKTLLQFLFETIAIVFFGIIFIVPFYFIIVNSLKTRTEAAKMSIAWPETIQFWSNVIEVLNARDGMLFRAFINSTVITTFSVIILVIICSMAAFVLQRRKEKSSKYLSLLFLSGLMVPPAIVPTIWVMELLGIFKTMHGIILIMVAITISVTIILYSGFIASIPQQIDDAAIIDGCSGWRLFFQIIFPLLKPIHSTVIILQSVSIFNDFVHPLYFFPGAKNATVQLTLYNFMSMFNTSWNLLFTNVLLITIPPFIVFLIFNKRIVSGMTLGAVKA